MTRSTFNRFLPVLIGWVLIPRAYGDLHDPDYPRRGPRASRLQTCSTPYLAVEQVRRKRFTGVLLAGWKPVPHWVAMNFEISATFVIGMGS